MTEPEEVKCSEHASFRLFPECLQYHEQLVVSHCQRAQVLVHIDGVDDNICLGSEVHDLLKVLSKAGENTEAATRWQVVKVQPLVFEWHLNLYETFLDDVDVAGHISSFHNQTVLHVHDGVQFESDVSDSHLGESPH